MPRVRCPICEGRSHLIINWCELSNDWVFVPVVGPIFFDDPSIISCDFCDARGFFERIMPERIFEGKIKKLEGNVLGRINKNYGEEEHDKKELICEWEKSTREIERISLQLPPSLTRAIDYLGH